jgi:hypothetical protein
MLPSVGRLDQYPLVRTPALHAAPAALAYESPLCARYSFGALYAIIAYLLPTVVAGIVYVDVASASLASHK